MNGDIFTVSSAEAIRLCDEALAVIEPHLEEEHKLVETWVNRHNHEMKKETTARKKLYDLGKISLWGYDVHGFHYLHKPTKVLKSKVREITTIQQSCRLADGDYSMSTETLNILKFCEKETVEEYMQELRELEPYSRGTYYQDLLKQHTQPEPPEVLITNSSILGKPDDKPSEEIITAVESFLLIGGIIFLVALVVGWFV